MADTDIIVSEMTPASQINTTDLMIMTQPDSQAETGYSTKSGTVLQVANKMLKGTEYSTDLPDFTDKTPLGGLEELKADIKALLPVDSASGNPCTFETNLADNLVSLKAAIVASGGNGTPSTPIPIVGHSELNLTNAFCYNPVIEQGSFDDNGFPSSSSNRIRTRDFIPVEPNTKYIINFVGFNGNYAVSGYPNNDISTARTQDTGWKNNKVSITTASDVHYIKLNFRKSDDSVIVPTDLTDLFIYTSDNTFTVSFGQTVYGGVYDANAGKVRITSYNYVYDGSEEFSKSVTALNGFYNNFYGGQAPHDWPIMKQNAPIATTLCNIAYATDLATYRNNYGTLYIDTGHNFDVDPAIFGTTVESFKAKLADLYNNGTPLEVTCELATPIEIDVSELSVDTIAGVNNITSDCGGDVEVQYRDSIQHYIDKKIAETQALIL